MKGDTSAENSSLAENIVARIGQAASWLILAMVLLTSLIVLLRYGFNMGWIWMQESVVYMHAAVFMLAAAWTLQDDGHVRVDIFYRDASNRTRAIIDLAGIALLLIPFCIYMLIVSWEYVAASWALLEGSREAGGLPGVYLLKSVIIAMPLLLLIQGLVIALRNTRLIRQSGEGTQAA